MAMDPYASVAAGYAAANKPLSIARTFDENARGAVRSSDIVIQATKIGTTIVTLADVPDGENWRVEYFAAFNSSGGDSTLRLYFVPEGGTTSAATTEVCRKVVATVTGVKIDEIVGYNMAPGERLRASCTADDDFTVFARLTRITQGQT